MVYEFIKVFQFFINYEKVNQRLYNKINCIKYLISNI